MASDGGSGGASNASGGVGSGGGGGGFRGRMVNYLYSGEKKHVFVGIAIIGAIFSVPWFLMNRGKHYQKERKTLNPIIIIQNPPNNSTLAP